MANINNIRDFEEMEKILCTTNRSEVAKALFLLREANANEALVNVVQNIGIDIGSFLRRIANACESMNSLKEREVFALERIARALEHSGDDRK